MHFWIFHSLFMNILGEISGVSQFLLMWVTLRTEHFVGIISFGALTWGSLLLGSLVRVGEAWL